MRLRIAAMAAVLALTCVSPAANAGTLYPIDFSALANDGTSPPGFIIFTSGPFDVYVTGERIVQPTSADYTGAIGITPESDAKSDFSLDIRYNPPGWIDVPFLVDSVSVDFASTTGGSTIYFDMGAAFGRGTPPVLVYSGSAPASGTTTLTETFGVVGGFPAPALLFYQSNANESQIVGVTIDGYVPPMSSGTVPEPASLMLGLTGLMAIAAASSSRRSAWRRCGAFRRSRR